MSEAHHIIRQYTFDVQSSNRAQSLALQERISHLFRQRISGDMDELLQRIVPEQMIAVLDTLELDLGFILYKDVETELPAKIMSALEKALADILRYGISGEQYTLTGKVHLKTGADRLFELMRHYLLSGVMPWWATAAEHKQPELAIMHLAGTEPNRLAALLRDIARAAYVRQRIAYQFPIAAIQQVVTVLEPAEAVFIFAYSREIVQLQQRQTILQTEGKTLERAVWWFVLNYLFTETSAYFNRKQFVRSHLAQMAQHFNVAYGQLLQLFYNALLFYKQDMAEASVGGFITTLYQEYAGEQLQAGRYPPNATDNKNTTPDEQIAVLRYYLLYGSFPWWAPAISLQILQQQMITLAKEARVPLQQMLNTVLRGEAAFKRWDTLVQTTGQQQPAAAQQTMLQQLTARIPVAANGHSGLPPFVTTGDVGANGSNGLPPLHTPDAIPPEQQQLRDVLLYRLLYGSIPWWGSTYAHFSINSLWQQLMEQSMSLAVAVFKYAGTIPYAIERSLQETTPEVLLRLMQAAKLPAPVLDVYESLYALLQTISAQIQPALAGLQSLQLQLLKSIWQTWALTAYTRLELPAFITAAIQSWAAATGLLPGSLLLLMKNAAPANAVLSDHLQQLINEQQTAWAAVYHSTGSVPVQHLLLDNIRKGIVPATTAEKEQTARLVLEWWQHFLATGHLPVIAGAFNQQVTVELVGKMLEWLYANYRERLSAVADVVTPSPLTLNQLFLVWQAMAATPTPVRELLAGWLQQAVTPPAAGTMIIQDGLWQEVPEPRVAATTEALPRISMPAAVSRLLHRFRQYDTISSATEQQHWLQQAIELLSYFLQHQKLPGYLGTISSTVSNELLKQAIILLHREKSALLTQLLNAEDTLPAARVAIYHLFTPPAGIHESQVRQNLEIYAVQDSLLLLQQTIHKPIGGFREAVQFYRNQHRQERLSFYQKIFQHTLLIEQAAQELDDATFLEMMQDIHIGWGHPPDAALKELQQLFDIIITDSQEREKIRLLFRQFHMQLLAGHFTVHHAAEYAQRFLHFITGSGVSAAESFIGRLAVSKGAINITAYVHLRNILPALQQQAAQYVHTHAHMEQVRQQLYEKDRQQLHPTQKPAAISKPPQEQLPNNRELEKIKPPELENIYVGNAGLVLLHPFLSFAFQRLGWLQEGKFISEEAQHRAIHLLQFTVDGLEEHPEHALALNKVLCNFPLAAPVPLEITLTEEEKQLSVEMLKVVIQRWEKMKNSSVEGFQGAFLQREGALRQTDEAWFLRVEQRAYDVIMQTLPWGIGTIKTPWMDKVLYTEWVYT